jgi:hypothetical protein
MSGGLPYRNNNEKYAAYKLRRGVSTLDFLRFTQIGGTSTQLVNCAAETHAGQAANFNSGQSVINGKLNQ